MPLTLTLTLTLQEVNALLNALARMPYIEVADLIAKVQQQAKPQVVEKSGQPEAS